MATVDQSYLEQNFTVVIGRTLRLTFSIMLTGTTTPMDVTGRTIKFAFRDPIAGYRVQVQGVVLDAVNGRVQVIILATDTLPMVQREHIWELWFDDGPASEDALAGGLLLPRAMGL